jgi:hypothetical protein
VNWKHLLGIAAILFLGAVIQSKTGIFKKIPALGALV